MTAFAQRHAISDVCVLCEDVERSIAFYELSMEDGGGVLAATVLPVVFG